MDEPIYRPDECQAAYQLNWSVTLFASKDFGSLKSTLEDLQQTWEIDGIRVLEWRLTAPDVVQLFLSTKPSLAPCEIIRFLKGRWQYAARKSVPVAFKRNYCITSVGSANALVLDQYVDQQALKHRMAQERVQTMFEDLQYHNPDVDLELLQSNSYGRYIYSLQVVVETQDSWNDVRQRALTGYRHAIQKACVSNQWRLSRIAILANHIHVLVGPTVEASPESVALSILNCLAESQEQKALFKFSYYVGTFGPYNRNAIWNKLDAAT